MTLPTIAKNAPFRWVILADNNGDYIASLPMTEANSSAILNAIGAITDNAWSGVGNGSEVAILKKIAANQAGPYNVQFLNAQAVETYIYQQILAGNGYQVTTGLLTTATNANVVAGIELLNNNTGSTAIIYSVVSVTGGNSTTGSIYTATTMEAALTNSLSALNLNRGSGNGSNLTIASSPNAVTASLAPAGTLMGISGASGSAVQEVLTNGKFIILPASIAEGIIFAIKIPTAGNTWGFTVSWIEVA